ncbi:DUF4157 domain-containing protein [Aquimarina sp. BL5]|uniref:eCIS core domain-containing protein n=1 Tax=Aquimarina sp. BL5 TaxID=1714860 RepID=UPI000E4B6AB0|nr:DUF4157 domain-containing protein [Aquimarina sp. BL5]AXT53609.1 DUF4157 domain-containing protein [Aquimarina sp. BL5]RKN03880.1 DUF4157 domain-containing protein [Aquimarina sp. BL5]
MAFTGSLIENKNPMIQAKLTIGKPNDQYEQEADRVADQVMKMPVNQNASIERKYDKCKEEELQMKPLAVSISSIIQKQANDSGVVAPSNISQSLAKSKGGGQNMDESTQSFMNKGIGADFSNVKIHTNDSAIQMNQSLGAKAFTNGNDIYFNKGQYNPQSSEGKHLLAHELTHVVQQGGSEKQGKKQNDVIQRYIDAHGTKGSAIGHSYRISDDLTTAVKVGYPNHDLYAKAGKVAPANTKLASVGSGIELIEESKTFQVSSKGRTRTLKKVSPKNKQNTTSGNTMKISDDCGTSCSVVVGSTSRTALHRDAMTGANSKTAATSPALMKAEIIKKLLNKWLTMASTSVLTKTKIIETLTKANAKLLEVNVAKADFLAAVSDAEKEMKGDIYWAKVEEYGDIMMSYYNKQSESKREEIDKYLKINKYANPNVGQGYTMSSGGTNYPGERTWNFHWGGVVMKSDDQKDTITLENYAVPGNVENERWDFAMYGTAAKKGQTFHEQHHDTKQHGDKPTTMTIEKK